jgi:hypothetical protein
MTWYEHRAVIVGEFDDADHPCIAASLTWLASGYRMLSIIAVANPYTVAPEIVGSPPFGMTTVDTTTRDTDAWALAEARARRVVEATPDALSVEHLVVLSWVKARRYLARHSHGHIFVAGRPTRFRDRIVLVGTNWTALAGVHARKHSPVAVDPTGALPDGAASALGETLGGPRQS